MHVREVRTPVRRGMTAVGGRARRDGTGSLDRVGGSPQGREGKGTEGALEAGLPPRALPSPSSPGRAPPLLPPPFPRPSHPPRQPGDTSGCGSHSASHRPRGASGARRPERSRGKQRKWSPKDARPFLKRWEADSDAERSFPQHPWESWKNALDSLQEEEDILTHQEVCRRSRGVPSWCAVPSQK